MIQYTIFKNVVCGPCLCHGSNIEVLIEKPSIYQTQYIWEIGGESKILINLTIVDRKRALLKIYSPEQE